MFKELRDAIRDVTVCVVILGRRLHGKPQLKDHQRRYLMEELDRSIAQLQEIRQQLNH